jgi:DNA repair exonuclease SbcCD nuclease subunit
MLIRGSHEDFPEIFKTSDKISYIFNGHYHKSQIIETSKNSIIVTGSVIVNDFGERNDNKHFFHLQVEED